jgi:hypothetical protein
MSRQITAQKEGNFMPFKRASALLAVLAVFSLQVNAQVKKQVKKPANVVDATNWNNKILAGYQGWFRTPNDNPKNINQGWSHLFNANLTRPGFDTWPDMSEFGPDEKTAVPGFTHPDGSQAYLYSAQNPKVVLRHFQWMRDYGLDGVWLSQFCDHFPGGRQAYDSTTVYTIMHNVQAAATATGRTWAFMWDMSGFGPRNTKAEVYNVIINNWKRMVDEGVTTDPRYMHQNGKPVLLIWGFFPSRPASQPDYMNPIIDFLQTPGKYAATLVSGVDPTWRKTGTPEFQAMLMRMPGLQPWSVGRAIKDPATGYKIQNTTLWADDIAKCKENGVTFQPVFNSGTHIAGPPPIPPAVPIVPRRTGNYLWEQFIAAQKTGVINSAFVAMFDEINEGTQLYKVTNKPPVQFPFLTYDGATSDYYLRLVGEGSKMLKTRKPITAIIPISPFSDKKWYKIKNRASKLTLNNTSKTAKGGLVQGTDIAGTSGEWQLLFDGNGYFRIKSRLSGKVLSATGLGVSQVADVRSESTKWRMEWDGTSFCRIINKVSGKALSNDSSVTVNTPVVQAPDATDADSLRWQIIEQ